MARPSCGAAVVGRCWTIPAAAEVAMYVVLRPLRYRDALLCWRLASDPEARRVSFDPRTPTLRGHARWMRRWVRGVDRRAWVVLAGGQAVGVVNVRREAEHSVIGVNLLPSARGRGLGPVAIRRATTKAVGLWGVPVLAEIKTTNAASVAAFRKAGYEPIASDDDVTRMMSGRG